MSKAEFLNNQFHLVYTTKILSDKPSKRDSPHQNMKNIHVRSNGLYILYKLLTGLNVYKAARPDAVPTRFLHDFALELAPIMTKLFQLSLDIGSARRLARSINCSHI